MTIIAMENSQISYAIPPGIENLASLNAFSMYNNQLTGTIPPISAGAGAVPCKPCMRHACADIVKIRAGAGAVENQSLVIINKLQNMNKGIENSNYNYLVLSCHKQKNITSITASSGSSSLSRSSSCALVHLWPAVNFSSQLKHNPCVPRCGISSYVSRLKGTEGEARFEAAGGRLTIGGRSNFR
ncbi:hypothetical protein WN944_003327 [Citrus x changshan-huyou]|uniref:Uncharacterized protein n=1 Tax=Citrus x changshan-huyou TaxID=2935761 RepID=A0AAP0M2Y6_9ROSI